MRVKGSVSCRSSQVLSLTEGDVLTLRVFVALSQTKVNNINVVLGLLCSADKEVIGLYVTVDDSFLVDFLDSLNLQHRKAQL
jgi:hypothetical protein